MAPATWLATEAGRLRVRALGEWPTYRRPVLLGLSLWGAGTLALMILVWARGANPGFDAIAYWAVDPADPYSRVNGSTGSLGGFRYAPAVAQLFALFGGLSFAAFMVLWWTILGSALVVIGRKWSLALIAFPPVVVELYHGNIHLLMALAILAGFRWPWVWAAILLTKVSPGIGLLWFAVRGEWQKLAVAMIATAVVTAVSFVLAPGLWFEWLGVLTTIHGEDQVNIAVSIPLVIRLVPAIVLVIWGARTDRPWVLPVAATLALPVVWFHGLAILAAVPALAIPSERRRWGV